MNSHLTHQPVPRRRVLHGAAWSVPAVALATAAPAAAASTPPARPGDLALAVLDPASDGTRNTPIYWGNTMRIAQHGDLPPGIIITNVGSTPVSQASGTLELQMQNMDGVSRLAYRTQVRGNTAGYTLIDTTPGIPPANGSRTYRWTLTRPLQPGATVTIPFEYFTPRIFANPDFSVLVIASLSDEISDDFNDTDARIGFVPGYTSTIFGP